MSTARTLHGEVRVSPIPRITYVDTWPRPKTETARSQVSKYRSMPVRAFGGDVGQDRRVERLHVDAHQVDALSATLIEDSEVAGRLELDLDGQAEDSRRRGHVGRRSGRRGQTRWSCPW